MGSIRGRCPLTEQNDHVADTHAIIWHLTLNPRLSPVARAVLLDADAGNRRIFVPSISLVEAIFLADRGRIDQDLVDLMLSYVENPNRAYSSAELDTVTVRAVRQIPRAAVPDMPDRIIAATALSLRLPLIAVDERIRTAGVVPVV